MLLAGILCARLLGSQAQAERTDAAIARTQRLAADPAILSAWKLGVQNLADALSTRTALLDVDFAAYAVDGTLLIAENGSNAPLSPSLLTQLSTYDTETAHSERNLGSDGIPRLTTTLWVKEAKNTLGILQLRWSEAAARSADAKRNRLLALVTALTTFALTGWITFRDRRAVEAVRRVTNAAARISRGELDARIDAGSLGEIGQLARAFNRMAGRVQSQLRKRRRERDRLDTVLHVLTTGVIMVTRKDNVRVINPAATKLLNIPPSDAKRRSFIQVVRDHRIVEVWQRAKESDKPESAAVELDGDLFVQVTATPYLHGVDEGILMILQDLSDIRHLQTVRQDFVSNVSHELRTPLASIRALVETLRDGAIDDKPAAQHFLDRMEIEVDSLTQMVQELLDLSRIESGSLPLQLTTTPTVELLTYATERLRPQAQRARVALTLALPPELPAVDVDRDRIGQVVTNLVHNAIKFTPPEGQITIFAKDVGAHVQVCVEDDGVGIPADDLPRIFERFYKADRARSGGGTGLGLAIAKHMVLAHGGEIWVESNEGRGSTFHFTLPVAGLYI